MSIAIEAIYEAGVFKPLTPIQKLKECEKVRLVVESISFIAEQRQDRIKIDPVVAQEIGNLPDYDFSEE